MGHASFPRRPATRSGPVPLPPTGDAKPSVSGGAPAGRLGRRALQAKLDLSRPGDRYERQAEAMASGTVRARGSRAPAGVKEGGQALPAELRAAMEKRLGGDLAGARVHADAEAARLSSRLGAEAFTVGGDMYFGAARYQPAMPEGMGLLAHELAHTLQPSSPSALCRQTAPGQGGAITVRDIFPFNPGDRLVANHLLNSGLFGILKSLVPDLAAFLEEGQSGTVLSATADLFEFRLDNPLTLAERDIDIPFRDQDAHLDPVSNGVVTLRLERNAMGEFDFGIFTQEPAQTAPVRFAGRSGLTAERRGAGFAFSLAGQTFLTTEQAESEGRPQVRLSSQGPVRAEALSLTALPSAPAGSREEEEAARQVTSRLAREVGPRHQRWTLGAGLQHYHDSHFLLASAWQFSFHPRAGDLFQVPLEVQVQYAPPSAVMGALTSGAEVSLASLQVPVNIRFVAGWGAGTVPGKETPAIPDPADEFLTGPILGAGLGFERDWFRFYVRYDHLFNILDDGAGVNASYLGAGGAW